MVFDVFQFESQDVLVPWRRPDRLSSSDDNKPSSGFDPSENTSTAPTSTSDEEESFSSKKDETSASHCDACEDAKDGVNRLVQMFGRLEINTRKTVYEPQPVTDKYSLPRFSECRR